MLEPKRAANELANSHQWSLLSKEDCGIFPLQFDIIHAHATSFLLLTNASSRSDNLIDRLD